MKKVLLTTLSILTVAGLQAKLSTLPSAQQELAEFAPIFNKLDTLGIELLELDQLFMKIDAALASEKLTQAQVDNAIAPFAGEKEANLITALNTLSAGISDLHRTAAELAGKIRK